MAIKLQKIVTIIMMKYISIMELVKGIHFDNQHQDNEHPQTVV